MHIYTYAQAIKYDTMRFACVFFLVDVVVVVVVFFVIWCAPLGVIYCNRLLLWWVMCSILCLFSGVLYRCNIRSGAMLFLCVLFSWCCLCRVYIGSSFHRGFSHLSNTFLLTFVVQWTSKRCLCVCVCVWQSVCPYFLACLFCIVVVSGSISKPRINSP